MRITPEKQQQKLKEARLLSARAEDEATTARMDAMDSNFYGLRHLMPMIETLAYISMECAWPKKKEVK